ncbi:MAG: CesT family type III secretion system chaperone [Verrucomicrobia bacterium]|nr:CesT family type III secretion system chaperone [Verrucomicrobiota bacterium]
MIDRFEDLLKELGTEYGVTLHPDRIGACKLNINDAFHIQLECDAHQENLLVATFICDIPPGKFRENILRDALKTNGPFPLNGTLAYSDKNNKLALFKYLRLSNLNGRNLADFLTGFVEKANNWRIGVETGNTAGLVPTPTQSSSGIFGLKP